MKNFRNYFLMLMALLMCTMSANTSLGQISNRTDGSEGRMSGKEVGQRIVQEFERTRGDFEFSKLSALELYSFADIAGSIIEVVYKPQNERGDILLKTAPVNRSPELNRARQNVNGIVEEAISRSGEKRSLDDFIYFEHPTAPVIWYSINDLQMIEELRNSPNVQSVNPIGIEQQEGNNRSPVDLNEILELLEDLGYNIAKVIDNQQGCVADEASIVNVTVEEGGYSVPWHYFNLNIPEANKCATGKGVKIAMLDSGVSNDQERLSTNGFKQTYNGRTITKLATFDGQVDDLCGHGTQMAGVAAAPQFDSAVRGVAYKSDFVSIRSHADVLLSSISEYLGVWKAINKIRKEESGTENTKVVSMSLGFLLPSELLRYEFYWVNHSVKRLKIVKDGPLLIAATGTSPAGYNKDWFPNLLPASYSWVTSVSGVYDGFPSTKKRCDHCFEGNNLDFVVPMQLVGGESPQFTHSLTEEGDAISKVGGSSIATATMAGVAAMVYEKYPNYSRTQVFNKLKNASTSPNSKDPKFGYGMVDAVIATKCTTDPCAEINCPEGQKCVNGTCVPDVISCADGGLCPPGFECKEGACVPTDGNGIECINGMCPQDMKCVGGICVYQ